MKRLTSPPPDFPDFAGDTDPAFSPNGQYLTFARFSGYSDIYQLSLAGGEETLVFDKAVYGRYWTVTQRGIYFVPSTWHQNPSIEFFNFVTSQLSQVVALERTPVGRFYPGLSVSPNGQSILCALLEQDGSDIMLVENFR
jgi:hypothetical protein